MVVCGNETSTKAFCTRFPNSGRTKVQGYSLSAALHLFYSCLGELSICGGVVTPPLALGGKLQFNVSLLEVLGWGRPLGLGLDGPAPAGCEGLGRLNSIESTTVNDLLFKDIGEKAYAVTVTIAAASGQNLYRDITKRIIYTINTLSRKYPA